MGSQKRGLFRRRYETHPRVYRDRSELVYEDGSSIVFEEGRSSEEARKRYEHIWVKDWIGSMGQELSGLNHA